MDPVRDLVPGIRSQAFMRGEELAREEAIRRLEPGQPIALGTAVVPSPEALELGEKLYVENCAASHGLDGKGRTAFTWTNLMAIGIWNGGAGDVGGQKSISIWHRLRIEP